MRLCSFLAGCFLWSIPLMADQQITVHYASFAAGLPMINYGVKYRLDNIEWTGQYFVRNWISGPVASVAKVWRFEPRSVFVPYVSLGGGLTPGFALLAPGAGFELHAGSFVLRLDNYGYVLVPTGMFFMLPTLGLGYSF